MAETLLVGLLLGLAAALTLLMARLYDMNRSTSEAAGAIAIECALARRVCPFGTGHDSLSASILLRELGEGDRQVLSGDALSPASGSPRLRAFWTGVDGQPLIADPPAIRPTRRTLAFDAGIEVAQAGARGNSLGQSLIERFGPGRFGFQPSEGLTVTTLSVPVSVFWPGKPAASTGRSLEIGLSSRAAILADAWNAAIVTGDSEGSIESRVSRGRRLDGAIETVVRAGYAPARGALRAAGAVGLEPLGQHFTPEQLDVSIVPSDRVPR